MGQYRAWIEAYGLSYLNAAAWTLSIALASFVCALVWGALLFFIRLRGGIVPDRIVGAYVQLFRNTPVLLPIYFIYFGFPLFGFLWPAAICGGIALVLFAQVDVEFSDGAQDQGATFYFSLPDS
jgi:polar amino acid transport system permease protein